MQPGEAALQKARPMVFKAIRDKNAANLTKLFGAGFPINSHIMGTGVTSLMVACSKLQPNDVGDTEIIKLLLELGADMN